MDNVYLMRSLMFVPAHNQKLLVSSHSGFAIKFWNSRKS